MTNDILFAYYITMLNKAYIDLGVLKSNARVVKSKLKKGVKFNAVVKADAYGHGLERVADALSNIVDCFSVAILEEAVKLRLSGINKDILVLTPLCECDLPQAVFYNLTATITEIGQVIMLERECERQGRTVRVHVKYNTGMNRLGVDGLKNLSDVAQFITQCKRVKLDGMFSHLGAPQNKKLRISAENKFLLANNLIKGYNNKAICHLGASGGFLKGVKGDMMRIGILLYGYKPFKSSLVAVEPVMKVFAPVMQKRAVKKGETVLYGEGTISEDFEYSIVRYGYADGLFREQVDGQVNNRCMDTTAILGVKEHKGLVPVMVNADALAKKYRTISYEVLTKSALRAEKIYINQV